jgi:hypothetical protein
MKNRAALLVSLWLPFASSSHAAPAELKIATWNLEWFMTPEPCARSRRHALPRMRLAMRRDARCPATSRTNCAKPRRHCRAEEARTRLNADVVALQEVDWPEAHGWCSPATSSVSRGASRCRTMDSQIRRGLPFVVRPMSPICP